MKRPKPTLCACPTCQQLDRIFPDEGRQIAMFGAPKSRKMRASTGKVAR